MNKEKLKTFWKDHKNKIMFGATTVTVGVACYMLGKSHGCPIELPEAHITELPLPHYKVGDWESFWVNEDNGSVCGIIRDIHVQFMGDLGVNIFDHCDDCGLTNVVFDSPVDVMFRIATDK